MKLRTAMIYARELGRMTAFYRDALGLTPLPAQSSDGWVVFDAGGVQLGLHAIPPHIAAGIEILDPPTPREETPIKLIFEVPDVDVARAHLVRHGAIMSEPRPWGACDGTDPEGNVFQIAQIGA